VAENSGFKGTSVHVSEVLVQGAPVGFKIAFRVTFSDSNGIVHAITRHELSDPPPDLLSPTKTLVEALIKWVESTHFTTPALGSKPQEDTRGLAESLRDPTDAPGGFIPQG
jgi:hypothetical protein